MLVYRVIQLFVVHCFYNTQVFSLALNTVMYLSWYRCHMLSLFVKQQL